MTDLSVPGHVASPGESPGKTPSGDSGHRFDTRRHWAACLSLAMSGALTVFGERMSMIFIGLIGAWGEA
mgnify:CR=1 FL=1